MVEEILHYTADWAFDLHPQGSVQELANFAKFLQHSRLSLLSNWVKILFAILPIDLCITATKTQKITYLQSWSLEWRCLRQKFIVHCEHLTGISSFFLQPLNEHLFVNIFLLSDLQYWSERIQKERKTFVNLLSNRIIIMLTNVLTNSHIRTDTSWRWYWFST